MREDRNARRNHPGEGPGRWDRIVLSAIMAPFTAAAMGGAGALMTAIVLALVSGGADRLPGAVVTLLFGVLVKGLAFGLITVVVIGVVTLVFDKEKVFATAGGGGILAFLGYGLWTIFATALEIHSTGAWIGAGAGAVLGVSIGVAVAWDDTPPEKLRAASRHRRNARGPHGGELEWWRGDIESIDEVDD